MARPLRPRPGDDPPNQPSYTPDQHWAEPDVDHAAELLRQIAAEPDEAKAGAALLARQIRRRYAPAAVAKAFRAAVAGAD